MCAFVLKVFARKEIPQISAHFPGRFDSRRIVVGDPTEPGLAARSLDRTVRLAGGENGLRRSSRPRPVRVRSFHFISEVVSGRYEYLCSSR